MHDDDFQEWIYNMPVGFMHYLWNQYVIATYNQPAKFPAFGDNFITISKLPKDAKVEPLPDAIDLFEQALMDGTITLADLIRRREE